VVGEFVDQASVLYQQTKSAFQQSSAAGRTWFDQEPLGGLASSSEWTVAYAGEGQRDYVIDSQVLAFSTLVPTRSRRFSVEGLAPAWASNDLFTSSAYSKAQASAYGSHRATAPQLPGATSSSPNSPQLPRLDAPASTVDPLLDFRTQTASLAGRTVQATRSLVVSRDALTGETISEPFTDYLYDWTSITNDLIEQRTTLTYQAVSLPQPIIEYQPVVRELTEMVTTSRQFLQPLTGLRNDYAIRLGQPGASPPSVSQRSTATTQGGTVRAQRVVLNGEAIPAAEVK
jgi:hypothetical protein